MGFRFLFDTQTQVMAIHHFTSPYARIDTKKFSKVLTYLTHRLVAEPPAIPLTFKGRQSVYLPRNAKLLRKQAEHRQAIVLNGICVRPVY